MARKAEVVQVVIKPPKIESLTFKLSGNAPFVQARFSQKAMQQMSEKMTGGSTSRSKKTREPRDFNDDMEQAKHISTEGWTGVPASAFRKAMISACRLVGFKMTLAKLSIFVKHDGLDKVDGIPLVRLYGEPELCKMYTRNATGVCDIRVRPMWKEWAIIVTIDYDADQFTAQDVTNLMLRVGLQVGIGEGRPDSRESAGLGWGTFDVLPYEGEYDV